MRFILTNLFTTLWCQKKTNQRRVLKKLHTALIDRVVG